MTVETVFHVSSARKGEVADFTDRVERRNFTVLFENFETYDVQETRRISKAEGRAEGKAEGKAEFVLVNFNWNFWRISEPYRKM